MAAKGIQFPRRWYGGMISANLEVIWVMSAKKSLASSNFIGSTLLIRTDE